MLIWPLVEFFNGVEDQAELLSASERFIPFKFDTVASFFTPRHGL